MTRNGKKIGRPSGKTRHPVNICLTQESRTAAQHAAFEENMSLSQFIDRLIRQAVTLGHVKNDTPAGLKTLRRRYEALQKREEGRRQKAADTPLTPEFPPPAWCRRA